MNKLYLLAFVSLALFIPSIGFAQGTESAEYKPPQVGTRIEYSNWSCNVEAVDGFATTCRMDDGSRIELLGWIEVDGESPVYLSDRSIVYPGGGLRLLHRSAPLKDESREAISGL